MLAPISDDLPMEEKILITAKDQEQVVVSGISGRLPESANIAEFREHLVSGDDMVTETDRRWPPGKIFTDSF